MQRQARARQEKKRREEEFFSQPRLHDPILAARYLIHSLAILFAVTAVLGPVLLAIFGDPESLAGTFFFIVAGVVISLYIYQHRKTWFRLGSFKTKWKDMIGYLSLSKRQETREICFYRKGSRADGVPYRIELLKTVDVKFRSYGFLNHEAGFKNKIKRVVIPRSTEALVVHRITTLLKIASILGCMIFFPVDSLVWRFLAGILSGGILSALVLVLTGVRSRVSYLFTPGLILKTAIWIFSLVMISDVGPGFNIHTSAYIYVVVAGLLFLLDMVLDLILGIFPFYGWFFRPVIRQGSVLEGLYRQGFQNYMELPVYSVLYPLYLWIF
jgi:hypothetical protein